MSSKKMYCQSTLIEIGLPFLYFLIQQGKQMLFHQFSPKGAKMKFNFKELTGAMQRDILTAFAQIKSGMSQQEADGIVRNALMQSAKDQTAAFQEQSRQLFQAQQLKELQAMAEEAAQKAAQYSRQE